MSLIFGLYLVVQYLYIFLSSGGAGGFMRRGTFGGHADMYFERFGYIYIYH